MILCIRPEPTGTKLALLKVAVTLLLIRYILVTVGIGLLDQKIPGLNFPIDM